MHDAIKRFEIEILLKAGLPRGRVAEIAGVSLRTVHRVRAEVEAHSAEAAASAEPTVQAAASPSKGGLGRPSKVAAYRDLVAAVLEAEPRQRRAGPTVNQLVQRGFVELGGQGPARSRRLGAGQHLLHAALRQPAAAGDLPLGAARLVAPPQDFLYVMHRDTIPRHSNLLSGKKVAEPGDVATLHAPAVPARTT